MPLSIVANYFSGREESRREEKRNIQYRIQTIKS
jgi:hypothetical protein